jgi:IPT/TIG domain
MKTHLQGFRHSGTDTLMLAIALLVANCAAAQSSPSPTIQDYDNTSLPAALQVGDTTFCNTQTITIHGQDFKRATGGELWDTTFVVFGTVAPTSVTYVVSGSGNNDRIVCQIPPTASIAGIDTCIGLQLIKKTHQGANV